MPPLSTRSRRAIDEHVAALDEAFGVDHVETVTVVNDREFFEHGIDIFDAGVRGGAGAWVYDEDGRVLLMRDPRIPDRWALPGGGHEPGESFVETAAREVWEEVGVAATVTDVWTVQRKRYVLESDPERRGYLLEVWFDARYDDGEAGRYPDRWDETEDEHILEVEWFSRRPDALTEIAARRADTWTWPDSSPMPP